MRLVPAGRARGRRETEGAERALTARAPTRRLKETTMTDSASDLAADFPGQEERIHHLKTNNNHFARLFEEYDELNHTISRIETRVEPTTEDVEEELKRKRVRIKDELTAMLLQKS
jgi:uncharacterized protein YdcH (DUF465 family)